MYVSFRDFGPNVPTKDRYERGVDYLEHEFDFDIEKAVQLVEFLKHEHSDVIIDAPPALVIFYISGGELYVQIDTPDGFWHGSNFDLKTAREILRVAVEGDGQFGEHMPGTDREWDVY
jgi:hypothetical protein